MRGRTSLVRLASLLSAVLPLHAEVTTFALDPVRSRLELRGTVNVFGLNFLAREQATDSLISSCEGRVAVEVAESGLQFVEGTRLMLPDARDWEPGPFGVEGFAPASFGLFLGANLNGLSVTGKAAFRSMTLSADSSALTLTNGAFDARRVMLRFAEGGGSAVDYLFILVFTPVDPDGDSPPARAAANQSTTVRVAGRHLLSGTLPNRATGGQFTVEDGVQTLMVPVDARLLFTVKDEANREYRFDFIVTGELVATPAPVIRFDSPVGSGAPLRLHWPKGYRLQRAPGVGVDEWVDWNGESPAEVPFAQTAEYFRLVPAVP